eukprot:m.986258 g.986258  ORF g.986258 m.986258 type:complete len:72 (+) comp23988_c0_seq22:535-750(+)
MHDVHSCVFRRRQVMQLCGCAALKDITRAHVADKRAADAGRRDSSNRVHTFVLGALVGAMVCLGAVKLIRL